MNYLNICLQGLDLLKFYLDGDHSASKKLALVAIDNEMWSYTAKLDL